MPHRCVATGVLLTALVTACRAEGDDAFQGVVEFDESALAFEVPGRLVALPFEEGDVLTEGDTVAHLDDVIEQLARDAARADAHYARATLALLRAGARPEEIRIVRADLRAARDELALAERTTERLSLVAPAGGASEAQRDQAETTAVAAAERVRHLEEQLSLVRGGARLEEVEQAQAHLDSAEVRLKLAEATLERQTLSSPLAGQVLETHADIGEVVGAGVPVVTVADVSHPYVSVFVSEDRIGEARVGRPVHVVTDATQERLGGVVEHIGRSTEYSPRYLFSPTERVNLVVRVRIRIDDPEGLLRAGTPAFVTWAGHG